MKSETKEKFKKIGKIIVKGTKQTGKFVGKYGPKAHAFFKGVSESTMGAFDTSKERSPIQLIPRRRKGYVDFTGKRKPKKVQRHKGGFYLDFT